MASVVSLVLSFKGIRMHNLSLNADFRVSVNATAAGTGDTINGTAIDMAGWEGILLIYSFGAITTSAVTTIKAQGGAASDGSDGADLLGTAQSIADTDDNKIAMVDIFNPKQRYIRPVITRATANAVINNVIAILYRGDITPAAAHSTAVRVAERFNSPPTGTA